MAKRFNLMDALMETIKAANRYVVVKPEHGGPSEQEAASVIRSTTKVCLAYAESGFKFKSRGVETPFGLKTLFWPLGVDDAEAPKGS